MGSCLQIANRPRIGSDKLTPPNYWEFAMRYLIAFAICCLMIPNTTDAQQGVATHNSYIRRTSSGQADSIGFAARGDTVELVSTAKRSGYLHVRRGHVSGWMWARNFSTIVEPTSTPPVSTFSTTIHSTPNPAGLTQCGVIGDAQQGTPDALSNQLKRNVLPTGPHRVLSFVDFKSLEDDYEALFTLDARHHKLNLTAANRNRLRNLQIANGTISEGDRVAVTGYLVAPDAHANTGGESVNCHLTGKPNNDYHITVAASPTTSGFSGIVVEMIPQYRESGWTTAALKSAQTARSQVLVVGQLFLDTEHLLNDDKNHPKGGQPPRFSLWEIHPIAEFYVCRLSAGCIADTPDGWLRLGH